MAGIIRNTTDAKFIEIIANSNIYSDAMRNCGANNVGNCVTLKNFIL